MRVGPAGWLYDSLEETIEMAGYTAEVSHGHPEGIKGAQAVAAAACLLSVKHLKQAGVPLTVDTLRARSAQYLLDEPFISTVSSCPSAAVGTMIQNGVFEEKMEALRADRAFAANIPALQSRWANERSARRDRTQQICDKVIAARKALGDWPPEEEKSQVPMQNAKKADAGKDTALKTAPVSKKS